MWIFSTTLVSAWLEQLTRALVRAMRLGDRETYWQDWPPNMGSDTTCYYEPVGFQYGAKAQQDRGFVTIRMIYLMFLRLAGWMVLLARAE